MEPEIEKLTQDLRVAVQESRIDDAKQISEILDILENLGDEL